MGAATAASSSLTSLSKILRYFIAMSFSKNVEVFGKTSAPSRVMLPERYSAAAHTGNGCKSKRMGLNGHPLGVCTVPPARDPVYLHFTLNSGPPGTIRLTENVRIREASDELTPGNIAFVFMPGAGRPWVNQSDF